MSRFDSMIAKGVNTFDANATANDILLGKTAYVANQKITGELIPSGGGGDYSELGTSLDIEAETTISKGNLIVARENNQYVGASLTSTSINISNMQSCSEDGSIIVSCTTSYINSGTVLNFYFRNEQTGLYDTFYSLTVNNVPFTDSFLSRICLSDDGTLAVSSTFSGGTNGVSTSGIILFEIDKENHVVSYQHLTYEQNYITDTDPNYYRKIVGIESVTGYQSRTSGDPVGNGQIIEYNGEHYLMCMARYYRYKVEDDTFVSGGPYSCFAVFRITSNGLIMRYGRTNSFGISVSTKGHGKLHNGEDFLFFAGSYICDYSFTNNSLRSASSSSMLPVIVTDNLYCCKWSNAYSGGFKVERYQLSQANLSWTLINTYSRSQLSTFGGITPNSDFSLAYLGNGTILDLNNETILGTMDTYTFAVQSKIVNNKLVAKSKIYAIVPSSNAQYLASATNQDCTTADRIYGVASHDMAVGTRGTARALFSSFSS